MISTTFNPNRAAETAAHMPAIPPPTTTKSKFPLLSQARILKDSDKNPFNSNVSSGGDMASFEKYIASQRPLNPVRSCKIIC